MKTTFYLENLKTSSYQTLGVQTYNLFHRAYQCFLIKLEAGFRVLLNQFRDKVVSFYSFVISLYKPVSPSAVRPRIIAVAINSVNSSILFAVLFYMNFIGTIHISLKVFKGLPFVLYTSASIILKRLMLLFVTPTKNLSINIVKSISEHSVLSSGFTQGIFSSTATRSRVSTFKVIPNYINGVSAITTTMPQRVLSPYSSESLYQELPKLQTSQYFHSTHIDMIAKLREWVKLDCGDNIYQLNKHLYA